MIVADTGAIVALIDADDKHHRHIRAVYEQRPSDWLLPWAILPEVDYLLENHVGARAARAFRADLATGAFAVEWGTLADLARARDLCDKYASLSLGLVDASVIAVAERVRASAIATVDLRDFGAVVLQRGMRLLPRDR